MSKTGNVHIGKSPYCKMSNCSSWKMSLSANVHVAKHQIWPIFIGKHLSWQISMLANVAVGKCPSCQMSRTGNVHIAKCPYWQMTMLANVKVGKSSWWQISILPNVQLSKLANVPFGKFLVNLTLQRLPFHFILQKKWWKFQKFQICKALKYLAEINTYFW